MAERKIANPTALGLVTFGIVVILFSMYPFGTTNMNGLLFGTFLFTGGVAFVFVGIFKFLNDDAYGATVFSAFGFMLLSFAVFVMGCEYSKLCPGPSTNGFVGWWFLLWGLFSFLSFLAGNFGKKPVTLQIALLLFAIELILIAVAFWTSTAVPGAGLMLIGGIIGIVGGIFAFYTGWGVFLNSTAGKKVLPI